jgi:hypothetical protein
MFRMLLAAPLLLGSAVLLRAQQPQADSTAGAVQGYAPAREPTPKVSERLPMARAVIGAAVVLPPRPETSIQEEIGAAQDELGRVNARLSSAEEQRSSAESLVQRRSQQLHDLDGQIKLADKEKRRADKASLVAEQKASQRQKQLAEGLEAVRQSEFDAARAAHHAAIAKSQALELELQLARARAQRLNLARGNAADIKGASAVVGELELQTLKAQKDYRRFAHELAEHEEDAVDHRLRFYQLSRKDLESGQ